MKSFSERKGLKSATETLQSNSMSADLRVSLWNALDISLWSTSGFLYGSSGYAGQIEDFSRLLWFQYFKKPMDERPGDGHPSRGPKILKVIRDEFFSCAWNEVYDFLEFVVRVRERKDPELVKFLNGILAREMAGYRLIDGHAVDITSEQEKAMLEEALSDTKFSGAASHLSRALEMLADRKNPDYRNSIKESISAVEAMARVVAGSPKATLGDALKALEKTGKLHTALKEGFSKLYGYASDEDGIRHAMLDEPTISQADAKYFLLSCTSFVNYLKASL
jgi:AbiJ N-terminal domain 4